MKFRNQGDPNNMIALMQAMLYTFTVEWKIEQAKVKRRNYYKRKKEGYAK